MYLAAQCLTQGIFLFLGTFLLLFSSYVRFKHLLRGRKLGVITLHEGTQGLLIIFTTQTIDPIRTQRPLRYGIA